MAILKGKEKDDIKSGIVNYLLQCNETVDTDVLVNKINSYLNSIDICFMNKSCILRYC